MSTSYDSQSIKSQGAASTNKRRWRDMGWSGTAGNGLTNLVRSARRSTDSLRSAASSASRNRTAKQTQRPESSTSSRPHTARLSVNKDLPPSPAPFGEESRRSSSSVSSRVIHNVPEEPPLEFYEMPPEVEEDTTLKASHVEQASKGAGGNALFAGTSIGNPMSSASHEEYDTTDRERDNTTPTNERHNAKRDTVTEKNTSLTNEDHLLTRQASILAGELPLPITARSASLSNMTKPRSNTQSEAENETVSLTAPNASYDGWTSEQEAERADGSKTPTKGDGRHSDAAQRFSSSARSLARKSLTRMRRKSTAAADDDATIVSKGAEPPLPTHIHAPRAEGQMGAGTQWASAKVGGGDGNTIAQLYAVFGLPKDPSVWTLAEEDCVTGVHHISGAINRFWRPEVLGCSICPPPSEVLGLTKSSSADVEGSGASKWEGRSGSESKKSQSPKFIEMSDGRGGTEKTETARVLSKALKLSFTREVEIVAEQGHYPPRASSHTFSFSVPTVATTGEAGIERSGDGRKAAMATGVSVGMAQAANGVGEGYGLTAQRRSNHPFPSSNEDGPRLATFFGVALTVWSAADDKRAKVIRKELARAAKQRGGQIPASKSDATKVSEGGWDDAAPDEGSHPMLATAQSPDSTFFMPYAICIVSRFPLYNLLGDWNKMAWHKYSRNIEMHNQLMSTILRHPAPRLGEEISVGSPEKDVSFHCTFPGAVEWGTGLIGIDFAMWPLFSTMSIDNILTIFEIALGYNGRILFISRHPALLGMAVETTRYLVEQCGWRGVVHQNCHARDVRIYLEDPGSWIIGINTELRGLVSPPKEVCVVDLDLNRIQCANPPAGAISTKGLRERRRRRLMQALFVGNAECSPPREFVDAYPASRFRPISHMVTRDPNSAYEQLVTPSWWDQTAVIQAFDAALREGSKSSFLRKMIGSRRTSRSVVASDSEIAAIMALRKRASTFVDARDGLENKIGRLNKRLAFLMSESEMWRAQFSKIQVLVDRLTKEANDLRGKVDKERRESKRLSSRLAQRDIEHVQVQLQLKETETAREEAIQELLRMKTAMESVEQEREAMMDEIRNVLAGGGNIDDVNLSVTRLDLPSFNPLSRSSSPTGSQASMTPSQAADYILKARAVAEARISEGRPGRTISRTNSRVGSAQEHMRSVSQDRGERNRKESLSATASQANHFPDEQMNYEIQQRTSVVTDQISRIQKQLESTLTSLEGRRSGTFERENERRRQRRNSNTSINSSRFEYRSSMGHGGAESVGGYASEDGIGDVVDYEPVESVKGPSRRTSRRRKERVSTVPPPTASSQSLREAYAASNASHSSLVPPAVQPKSMARQRASSTQNGWKLPAAATEGTAVKVQESGSEEQRSPDAEVVHGTTADDEQQRAFSNGVSTQPLLSALKPREGETATELSPTEKHSDGHAQQGSHEASISGGTSPTLAMPTGPEAEALISQSGWVLDSGDTKKLATKPDVVAA